MRGVMWIVVVVVVVALVVGCSSEDDDASAAASGDPLPGLSAGDPCSYDAECSSGLVCELGSCAELQCMENGGCGYILTCPWGEVEEGDVDRLCVRVCAGGVCQPTPCNPMTNLGCDEGTYCVPYGGPGAAPGVPGQGGYHCATPGERGVCTEHGHCGDDQACVCQGMLGDEAPPCVEQDGQPAQVWIGVCWPKDEAASRFGVVR